MADTTSIREMLDLSGEGAIVTGGAKGIGRAISLRLAEAGAGVLIVDIDEPGASATADEIRNSGGRAASFKGDASNARDAEGAAQACIENFRTVDILVNNAGIFPFMPADQMTESEWDRVLNINLKGTFLYAKAAASKMMDSGGGIIVNIASIDAVHPTGNLAHYDASKGGVLMLTKALALEWAPHGVRVNAILPGSIATPGAAATSETLIRATGMTSEQMAAAFTQRIPLKRAGDPDEVAMAVLFLASRASSYVTGASLVVDGGYLLS